MSGYDERDRWDDADEDQPPRRRIIDLSDDKPVVTEVDQDYPFHTHVSEQVRVYVARSSGRGCAIPIILVLLALCCACLGFWVLADNLF